MRKLSNFKLGIGFPCSWSHIPFPTFMSLMVMERPDFVAIPATNGPIDGLRNAIVEDALALGCSHLLMPDLDQTYPHDLIPRLLAHRLPVVGAMVHRRYPPFDPLVFKHDGNGHVAIEEWENGELIEVSRTGTGCLLFDMKIFRELPRPWFRFRNLEDGSTVGEDFGLCDDLNAAGYKVHVDSSIKCGHLSTLEVTEATWELYKCLKRVREKENDNG